MKLAIPSTGNSYTILTVNQSQMVATMQIIDFNLNVETCFVGVFYETI